MDAALLAVSLGQAQGHGGRAILGNGGGATRHSRVAGLLRAKEFAGVQAAAGTIRNARKPYVIADLAAECGSLAGGQRICSDLMVAWRKHELRLFIASLMGLSFMVAVGPGPRKQDLIATIINTSE